MIACLCPGPSIPSVIIIKAEPSADVYDEYSASYKSGTKGEKTAAALAIAKHHYAIIPILLAAPGADTDTLAKMLLGIACKGDSDSYTLQGVEWSRLALASGIDPCGKFYDRWGALDTDGDLSAVDVAMLRSDKKNEIVPILLRGATDGAKAAQHILGMACINNACFGAVTHFGADIVKICVELGADPTLKCYTRAAEFTATGGRLTAYAIAKGNAPEAVPVLLRAPNGGSKIAQDMLQQACIQGDVDKFKEAISAGADAHAHVFDGNGLMIGEEGGESGYTLSAVHLAASRDKYDVVIAAIDTSTNADGVKEAAQLLLGNSAKEGNEERTRKALASGADVDAVVYDEYGQMGDNRCTHYISDSKGNRKIRPEMTAAEVAARNDKFSVLSILVAAPGVTAKTVLLGKACVDGDEDRARKALDAGADSSLKVYNQQGETCDEDSTLTAAQVALGQDHWGIITMLLAASPTVSVQTAPPRREAQRLRGQENCFRCRSD